MPIIPGIPPPPQWLAEEIEEARIRAMDPRTPTQEQLIAKHEEFYRAIGPLVKAKIAIHQAGKILYTIAPNQHLPTMTVQFTPEQQRTLDLLDEVIQVMRREIYGDLVNAMEKY